MAYGSEWDAKIRDRRKWRYEVLTRPTAAVIAARGIVAASSKVVCAGMWKVVFAHAMEYSANELPYNQNTGRIRS
jgi:hypothetical protein